MSFSLLLVRVEVKKCEWSCTKQLGKLFEVQLIWVWACAASVYKTAELDILLTNPTVKMILLLV